MSQPQIADGERLPCGCLIGNVQTPEGRAFVMMPCSLLCENYTYAMGQIKQQGKPVVMKVVKE